MSGWKHLVSVLIVVVVLSAPVWDSLALAQDGEGYIVHVIQPGETLSEIARHYSVPMNDIMAVNNIANPNRIFWGLRLLIPTGEVPAPETGPESVIHTVQRGETLFRISLRYNMPMGDIIAANHLANPNSIYAGQQLLIPIGSLTADSTQAAVAPASSTASATAPAEALPPLPEGVTLVFGAVPATIGVGACTTVSWHVEGVQAVFYQDRPVTGVESLTECPTTTTIYELRVQLASGEWLSHQITVSVTGSVGEVPTPTVLEGNQIVIDLSQQQLYAFENGELVRQFTVSTGLPGTPTVTGDFSIYLRHTSQRMQGPDYDLPNVPWVMYFYGSYSIHGTYWHNNFGQPMSHGCVNMRTPEAEWLFNWAPIGTPVRVIN